MALPATDWISPISYAYTAANAKEMIKAIYDAINANSMSYVTITDYDANEAHIELSVSGNPSMRLLFFGGQTPNSSALYGNSAVANYVYCLCAPNAGTTGPDQSYTVGNPYNSSDANNTLGTACGSYSATSDLLRIFECSDGVGVFWSVGGSANFMGGIAGALLQSPDKNTKRYCAIGGGGGNIPSTWAQQTTAVCFVQTEIAPSSNDSICSCIVEGYGNAIDAYRVERIQNANNLKDTDGRGVLVPIVMASDTGNFSPGTLRGLYMGPRAAFGNTVNGSDGWAMAGADETDALYFANI